jgi:hypothetical protein
MAAALIVIALAVAMRSGARSATSPREFNS